MGYELASGAITVHPDSDIDLVIYAPYRVAYETAASWNAFNVQRSVSVDAMLETPEGACSLTEYVRSRSPILLRTINGPRLMECPWTPET
jgi:phosphoribosyl-dephospho-CoA transferase